MLVPLLLLADYWVTLDLSDRTELRPRVTDVLTLPEYTPGTPTPGTGAYVGFDVFEQPRAFLEAKDRRWDFTLTYMPTVTAPDLELGFAPELLNIGDATARWHDRVWTLSLNEDFTFGTFNSAYLVYPQTPTGVTVTIVPTAVPATINFGFTHTYASVALQAARHVRLVAGAEYTVTGGLDAVSRTLLPLEYGPRATGSVDYQFTRLDHIETDVAFQRTDFDSGPCYVLPGEVYVPNAQCAPQAAIGQGEEIWRHQVSRTTSLMLGAGAGVAESRVVSAVPYETQALPIGDAAVIRKLETAGSTLQLTARYGPYVDVRTGNVIEAAQGTAALKDALSHFVTLRVNLQASQGFPQSNPVAATIVGGEVGVDLHVVEARRGAPLNVDLSVGQRGAYEAETAIGTFATVFGYFAVTVIEPTLHL